MKYYEGCRLTVGVRVPGQFDEAAIRKALDEVLPGIQITFRRDSAITVFEAADAFVPHDHPVAGAEEQDSKTKKRISVGGRLILTTAVRSWTASATAYVTNHSKPETAVHSMHLNEIRPPKNHRGVGLISHARREVGERFMDTTRAAIHSARRSSSGS